MSDYFGGQTPQELEELLRRLVTQGAEGPKVDFKKMLSMVDKAAQAELAKDISSIANTDDESHLDDFGYIILGAERGQLTGGVAELEGDVDKLQAHITDLIKGFIGPVPQFTISAFEDPSVGRWGVIVIPPSARQPHLFVRDGLGVFKHEWWVRVNDTKERAAGQDYGRIMAKATRREIRPLELEVQRLSLRLDNLATPDLGSLVEALRGSPKEDKEAHRSDGRDLVTVVRSFLVRGSASVEDQLVTEALKIAEMMSENSSQNPWHFTSMDAEDVRALLSYYEEKTFPFAEALATIARYDTSGQLSATVCRSLRVIAGEPEPSGTYYSAIEQFRIYPLVLCLYAITLVAVREERGELLRSVFGLRLRRRNGSDPIVAAVRRIRAASDVFKAASETDWLEPIAVRVREVLVPRLTGLLAGAASKDAFYIAEFVLGLAFLQTNLSAQQGGVPLPGVYFYEGAAQRVLADFLGQRPAWLSEVLGESLDTLLLRFDQSAVSMAQQRGFADGFLRGAVAAYQAGLNKV